MATTSAQRVRSHRVRRRRREVQLTITITRTDLRSIGLAGYADAASTDWRASSRETSRPLRWRQSAIVRSIRSNSLPAGLTPLARIVGVERVVALDSRCSAIPSLVPRHFAVLHHQLPSLRRSSLVPPSGPYPLPMKFGSRRVDVERRMVPAHRRSYRPGVGFARPRT